MSYNNDSYEFWMNYYKNDYLKTCELMKYNYKEKLKYYLTRFKENAKNRKDKNSNKHIIQQCIRGQLNQIKAIETILCDLV